VEGAYAVETRSLVKRFGEQTAVDGLDLAIEAGAFFGLLGPNGAGKTTTISILCTLLRPTSGSASVCGHDVLRDRAAVRRQLGIVFQEPCLDSELSGRENLDIHARLYHLADRPTRVAACLELMGLERDADRRVAELSGGMRRRLEITRGLLHQPRVLFLDEPTLGLDVPARRKLWEHLERLRDARDMTFLLTTHYMDEAARLCDAVAVIDGGRTAASGTPRELCRAVAGDRVELELGRPNEALAAISAVPNVRGLATEGGVIVVTLEDAPAQLAALVQTVRHFDLKAVRMREANLEDAFLHFTGHGIEPEPAEI
jgi:ABC-2 type transport system ATP-binding protein